MSQAQVQAVALQKLEELGGIAADTKRWHAGSRRAAGGFDRMITSDMAAAAAHVA